MDNRKPHRRGRWHLALLLVPFIWQVALLPLVNDVRIDWLAVPFPMLWQMIGIVIATAVIGLVFRIDRKRDSEDSTRR